ncbi:Ubiquitin fusion degradation protein 1 [Pseudocercospora fuligena]|uniref:Ubiquitin fusion degradation protein 1 n=1 Tax=Pseudocercospora fuligena TaxID=685502 RepID=A0A8H6RP58_9PEZI|nr:Ubiquitin fusion degradation protein 1 [Pseudocercospora fuligena]
MTETPQLKWSAQYTVTAPSRSHPLPGDKILLPPSALEALLSASSNLAAETARRDLPQYDPYNSATYSAYRQAESQYQDQKQQLPYPLTFRLVNPEKGRVVYAGIREFSASEGHVVLSSFLLETLGLNAGDLQQHEDAMQIDEGDNTSAANGVSGPQITVHARQLPKGTFVKLRPLEPGYDPEDWKALLEQHLRANYTTMTNGEVLVVPGGRGVGGKKEEFRFLVDGFKPEADGICVVDTDLEVDIEALNEEQARETMKRIAAKMQKAPGTEKGSSPGGELDLFKEQAGQVLPGEYVDYTLPSWNRAQALELELDAMDDDEDISIFINPLSGTQRAKPRIDEFVFADLDTRPRKRIRLEPTNAELEHAEALQVSVHAFASADSQANGTATSEAVEPRHYTIRARHPDSKATTNNASSIDDEAPLNEGDVRCKNCKQWVPQRTLMLHENFCLRNNILCPKGCDQVFQKRSPEFQNHWHCPHDESYGNSAAAHQQHDSIFHPADVLRCSDCSTAETFANLPSLARHRTSTCPGKLILCRFCHLEVPQEGDPDVPNAEALLSGMTPHELADGARTTECHLCSKIVRLRDMETHLKNHDMDRLQRPTPTPCRNVNCGRTLDTCSKSGDTRAGTRMGQGPGNDVGLCSVCFGPLYVSMYDPENKALRRRIERRYLQQLLTGCGKSWCKNEFCKTGRKNLDLNTNITTKDALPMVKPFLDVSQAATPLHFCVDEKSQRQRNLAEMIAAEEAGPAGKGGFAFEWCLGALEAEGGDLDGARQWLKNWAPARGEERR